MKNGSAMSGRYFRNCTPQSVDTFQHRGLVQGDVIGLVALDFILRLVPGGMVDVAFVIDVPSMDFDDFSAYPPSFRIPAYVIANLERLDHITLPVRSSVYIEILLIGNADAAAEHQISTFPSTEQQEENRDEG